MTHDEARRLIEATTDFDIRDGMVLLRDVRVLRAVGALRAGRPTSLLPLRGAPTVGFLAERAR